MGKFDGKVFLELGTNIGSVDIVKYAKSEGAYVIVVDYFPKEKSEAKQYANETSLISTLDIDAIVSYAIEKGVSGVFCGVSEINLQSVQRICDKLKLPCYFNRTQWDNIQNKHKFKMACIDSNISVPKLYSDLDSVVFPVIVKPAECGASVGISICRDQTQLRDAYALASSSSRNGKVIIEEYIEADDVMVFFDVHNGIVDLSAVCDRLMYKHEKDSLQIPAGYMYPSKHIKSIEKGLRNLSNLIKKQGIKNGLFGFQCFVRGNDLIPFDPTIRLDGTTSYVITEIENNINVMKMLVDYSLLGTMGEDSQITLQENPFFRNRYFQLPIILGKGEIESVVGIKELRSHADVIKVNQLKREGDILKYESHFTQIGARIHLKARSCHDLKQLIKDIISLVRFEDKDGNNLVLNGTYDYDSFINQWFMKSID